MKDSNPFANTPFYHSNFHTKLSADQLMSLAMEHSLGGILLFEFNGKILYYNRNFAHMFGLLNPEKQDFDQFQSQSVEEILRFNQGINKILHILKEDGYWVGDLEILKEGSQPNQVLTVYQCRLNIVYDATYDPICIYGHFNETFVNSKIRQIEGSAQDSTLRSPLHSTPHTTQDSSQNLAQILAEDLTVKNTCLQEVCQALDRKNLTLQLVNHELTSIIQTGNPTFNVEQMVLQASEISAQQTNISHLHQQLSHAMAKIKELKDIIPICAYCKKIRDEHGEWKNVEEYIHEHSGAGFSHSLCPECLDEHYGTYLDE